MSVSAASLPRTPRIGRPAAAPGTAPAFKGRFWSAYLVVAVVLLPFVHPIGAGQFAIGDVWNLVGLIVFTAAVLARGVRLTLPFIIPAFVIMGASLVATTNAQAPDQSILTIVQDVYLYVWFVMLVNVLRSHGDLRTPRVTWMVMSVLIALYGVYELRHNYGYGLANIISPKGVRAQATFGNANFFADYLVISVFVIASLKDVNRLLRTLALGAVLFGLLASKSLGGVLALLVGAGVWALVRLGTRGVSRLSLFGGVCVLLGGAALGIWVGKEWGVGRAGLEQMASQSMLGRADKSSEGRFRIWGELLRRFEEQPLGIGPGNSSVIELSIENRERRGSILGKEAHNDYVGYAVERGPAALLAMLAVIALAFGRIASGWRAVRSRARRAGIAGAWAAALAGGLTASTVHSLTVEKLHFRHFWYFMAMLVALSAWMSLGEQPEDPTAGSARRPASRAA